MLFPILSNARKYFLQIFIITVAFPLFHSSYIQKEVRAVEQAAVRRCYEQYKNGIFRYALSITKDEGLSEDILQETFLRFLTAVCVPGKEQAWLYRVARNLCYDHLRKAKREEPEAEMPAHRESRTEIPVYKEVRYAYIELIASLSPVEQEIVTLKIVGGLTHREIGAVLGITARAAQKRYERAIASLREMEDEHGTETL